METVFDRVVELLRDAVNAASEAEDEGGSRVNSTQRLERKIDAALRCAISMQEREIRLATDDGPDPDVLRDRWLEERGDRS